MALFIEESNCIANQLCDYIGEINDVKPNKQTKLGFCSGWTVRAVLNTSNGTEKFIEKIGQKCPGRCEPTYITIKFRSNIMDLNSSPFRIKSSCYICVLDICQIKCRSYKHKVMRLKIMPYETMNSLIIMNSDKRYIFIPIICISYDYPTKGHGILLIIDNQNHTFNIFDSNGEIDLFSLIYNESDSVAYMDKIHKLFDRYIEIYNLVYNAHYCFRGFISTECVNIPSENSKKYSVGYCDMWVFFMMKYINERCDKELSEILKELYNSSIYTQIGMLLDSSQANSRIMNLDVSTLSKQPGILIDNFMHSIAKNIIMTLPRNTKNIKLNAVLKNIKIELKGKQAKLKVMKRHLRNIGYGYIVVKDIIDYYKANK